MSSRQQRGRPRRPDGPTGSGPGRGSTTRVRASGIGKVDINRREPTAPPKKISRRAATIAVVLSLLALAIAPLFRIYIEQRIEIDRLEQQQVELATSIDDLEEQRSKWDDDDYIATLARERLDLVRPGEELIKITGDDETPNLPKQHGDKDPDQQWFETLLDTFEATDNLTDDDLADEDLDE